MKKLILTTTIICGFALPAMATMETRLMMGCVVYPIPNTNAWQKQDPECNFIGLDNKGGGKDRLEEEEEEPPVDPVDPVDPADPEPEPEPEEPTEPEEPSEPEPEEPSEHEDTKPGRGHGDKNHEHSGPPGLNKKG